MRLATQRYVIHPDWLVENLDAPLVRILDARPAEFYADSHIPNAVSVDMNQFRYTHNQVEGLILPPDEFAQQASLLGIDERTQVIIYDDYHGLLASRIAWSFLRYGHHHIGILDGGWDKWEQGGYPTSDQPPIISPRPFTSRIQADVFADSAYIRAHPQALLLDVRAQTEYQKGHLPNAVLWDWQNGTSDDGLFGDLPTIQNELASLGVLPNQEIIIYCQSGVRASHTFFLLHQLGFSAIRLYDGSWAEWSILKG